MSRLYTYQEVITQRDSPVFTTNLSSSVMLLCSSSIMINFRGLANFISERGARIHLFVSTNHKSMILKEIIVQIEHEYMSIPPPPPRHDYRVCHANDLL